MESSRFYTSPKVLIVEFYSYVNIIQINILMQKKKIPELLNKINPELVLQTNHNNNNNTNNYYYYNNEKKYCQ